MFGIIVWSLFGIIIIKLGLQGFRSEGYQFQNKKIKEAKGKLVGSFLIILGILSFAFAFMRLVYRLSN